MADGIVGSRAARRVLVIHGLGCLATSLAVAASSRLVRTVDPSTKSRPWIAGALTGVPRAVNLAQVLCPRNRVPVGERVDLSQAAFSRERHVELQTKVGKETGCVSIDGHVARVFWRRTSLPMTISAAPRHDKGTKSRTTSPRSRLTRPQPPGSDSPKNALRRVSKRCSKHPSMTYF